MTSPLPTPAPPSSDRPAAPGVAYTAATRDRAGRAVRCGPFSLAFYATLRDRSVALGELSGQRGVQTGFAQRPLAEMAAEGRLVWLIQVGVLRREVDGQGIADGFRLTPLGAEVVAPWVRAGRMPPPSWGDRLRDFVRRWLPSLP